MEINTDFLDILRNGSPLDRKRARFLTNLLGEQTELEIECRQVEAIIKEAKGKGVDEFKEALKGIKLAQESIKQIFKLAANNDFEGLDLEMEITETQGEDPSFEELHVYGVGN